MRSTIRVHILRSMDQFFLHAHGTVKLAIWRNWIPSTGYFPSVLARGLIPRFRVHSLRWLVAALVALSWHVRGHNFTFLLLPHSNRGSYVDRRALGKLPSLRAGDCSFASVWALPMPLATCSQGGQSNNIYGRFYAPEAVCVEFLSSLRERSFTTLSPLPLFSLPRAYVTQLSTR